jgi:hypothetical protein
VENHSNVVYALEILVFHTFWTTGTTLSAVHGSTKSLARRPVGAALQAL